MSLTSRLLAAWLSLSLVLTLTPCCEVLADIVASAATDAAYDHGHDGPDGAPHSPGSHDLDPCAEADSTLNSLPVAVTAAPDSHHDIPIARRLLLAPAGAMAAARPSPHPPPHSAVPLYLRIAHLLL